MKKQKCTIPGCGKESIPGLLRGNGKCQYHYNVGQFGRAWADKVEADRKTVDQILNGMARAFFASAWADACDEAGESEIISNGVEIMDVVPDELDPAAVHAASTLRMDMERVNGRGIGELFAHAKTLPADGGDRELTAELFGHYCAMQAMGHGVGLESFGDAVRDAIQVPYVEFGSYSLEKDYFPGVED